MDKTDRHGHGAWGRGRPAPDRHWGSASPLAAARRTRPPSCAAVGGGRGRLHPARVWGAAAGVTARLSGAAVGATGRGKRTRGAECLSAREWQQRAGGHPAAVVGDSVALPSDALSSRHMLPCRRAEGTYGLARGDLWCSTKPVSSGLLLDPCDGRSNARVLDRVAG
eukprot:TRINITY_DN14464_c0_g1_i1.p1 TRINITY_DN14464_c0_g1~~TRINITY_DN14464_c0_g1_i1.p1  ORF type:complete len:186 (+),score=0.01 TRINITY_DN14464_c0_g1_i1:59-559(+)